MSFKRALYNVISGTGVRLLQKIFPEYFAKEPLAPTDRYLEYPFVMRNLPKPPVRVLDVGCAASFFPLLLASFGYEAYGMDIREYAIVNKVKFANFRFVKEDIRKTSFPDNYFDAITAISTVEHIGISGRYGADEAGEADREALQEMMRILKTNGVIILTVPFGKARVLKPYCRIYDAALLQQLVRGLVVEKEEYYMQDASDDWCACSRDEAQSIEAKIDRYAVCLLKLVKR
jgi:ubiquinone/menaquinone biosynthesis C-methylase UbiE